MADENALLGKTVRGEYEVADLLMHCFNTGTGMLRVVFGFQKLRRRFVFPNLHISSGT
jgi:hypothetical protein